MFKRLTTISILLFLLGATGTAYAVIRTGTDDHVVPQQTDPCTGTVKDKNGESIIGATVILKGTTNGSITGMDGEFSLSGVKKGDAIQISFVGYQPVETIWDGTPLNIVLKEDSQELDEVVVTALGIKRQSRALGYSTTQVGGKDFQLARDPNVGNALSGKIAGVSVAGNATGDRSGLRCRFPG